MHFVVWTVAGPGWVQGRPLREQPMWSEHAAFMNGLAEEGVVVLGGPVGGAPGSRHQALLVVSAASDEAVRARLGADPWSRHRLLQIESVHPWEILLGELPES